MRVSLAFTIFILITSLNPDSAPQCVTRESEQGKPIFTFGTVADVQYCDCNPDGERYFRSSPGKLREAISSFKSYGVGFIVNLGDLIDSGYKSYMPIMDILDSSGIKVYHVTGNHDYYVDGKYLKLLPPLAEHKSGFYSFVYQGFRLVFLNGNEVSIYSTHSKKIIAAANDMISNLRKAGEPNGLIHNGAIGADQLVWLDSQLREAESAAQKVIIFCHFPVWPVNEHNLLNYRQVLDILGNHHNVIAWFNGHNHSGNYGNLNMTHFINLKGMCETEKINSFAIIEVYHNRIWVKGEGREKSQIVAY